MNLVDSRSAWILMAFQSAAVLLIVPQGHAGLDLFYTDDRGEWESAVEVWDTMSFQEFDLGTHLTDQYLDRFGVTFIDGMNLTNQNDAFFEDGFGISYPNFGGFLEFELVTPQFAGGFSHPGGSRTELWSGDVLVSEFYHSSSPGEIGFVGWISDIPIDRIRIDDGAGIILVDDIMLALPIPVPGAGAAILLGFVARRGRRRTVRR